MPPRLAVKGAKKGINKAPMTTLCKNCVNMPMVMVAMIINAVTPSWDRIGVKARLTVVMMPTSEDSIAAARGKVTAKSMMTGQGIP